MDRVDIIGAAQSQRQRHALAERMFAIQQCHGSGGANVMHPHIEPCETAGILSGDTVFIN